jgi:hypothetical protein
MASQETIGNWGEYQRLVLAELERHNALLRGVDDRIQSLKLELELIKQTIELIRDLQKQVKENTKRLDTIEREEQTEDALKKYRNWIVGLLFVFITALLLPVINLIIHALGGGG